MEGNLKHKRALLIIGYGILIQLCTIHFYELKAIKPELYKSYFISKALSALLVCLFLFCIHTLKYIKHWLNFFYVICFVFIFSGQHFHPGYHFSLIQFMFLCTFLFEGFPWAGTIFSLIFILDYKFHFFSPNHYPTLTLYQNNLTKGIISSWVVSAVLERYVNRVRFKHTVLDRKLRYKGIKTDLFLHDLKNKLQPLVLEMSNDGSLQEILRTIQKFNSFQDEEETIFEDVVNNTKMKFDIVGECIVTGGEDFFIDQMDLQTILGNLMKNSQKACELKGLPLRIHIYNTQAGFIYEDNAGGFTEEQFKFFTQKEFKPYPGHEKNGLGLLLIKKLVEHHGGKLLIKRILGGSRFEISY